MWIIKSIETKELYDNCEEIFPGTPAIVSVLIEADDGRVAQCECTENWVDFQGLEVGDEWPEDIDEIDKEAERIDKMSRWMDNYYDALDEFNDV